MAVVFAFNVLLLLTCGYAIWRGGEPERWAGAAFLIAAGATLLINMPRQVHFDSLELEVLLVDLALLAVLIFLVLKANRYWPIWIAAIHATAVAGHWAKLTNPGLVWQIYATTAQFSSVPIVLMLGWATWRHRQRLARFGSDPSWSGF